MDHSGAQMSWTKRPELFADEVERDHRDFTAKIAIDMDQRLVTKTPVDTGRAQNNWFPSIGAASARVETGDFASLNPIAEAVQVFSAAPKFPVLFIANNLPYIEALNNGHSKQAPAHFVEQAINEAADVF
jgi:hypothetical protein